MSSTVFPGQHTTTTTITASETQVNPTIRFDNSYLFTLNGQLKIVEIVASFIALFVVSFSDLAFIEKYEFFETIALSAVWWNTILLVFYLFHVIEKFYKIPWIKVEVISCIAFAAFYFLSVLLSVTYVGRHFIFMFITLSSIGLTAVFGYDAYRKLQALQAGEIAQGVRVISQVTEVNQPQPQFRY